MADFRLPDGDGAAAARALRALDPAPQVVMLTADAEDRTLLAALAAGCCGLVTKGVASARLGPAIRAAAVGDGVFSPDVASRVAHLQPEGNGGAALSGREIAVLEAVARGRERAEIARDLEVSESAVRTHLRDVLTKFGPG
jgi:DNA-binding NarL/FixJ family response regulator